MAATAFSSLARRDRMEASSRPSAPTTTEPVAASFGRLKIEACHGDRGCIVRLNGDLDTASARDLSTTLKPWAESCRRLILDLRQVTFLDSAGLRAILDVYRVLHERGVSLHLVEGEQGNVPRVLRNAGLEPLIDSSNESLTCR